MTEVVIVGSGFAGCTAVRTLRKLGFDGGITVVSPGPELFYFPSLIWVPSGMRTEDDLTIDLRGYFRDHGVEHRPASVTGLDAVTKTLRTESGDLRWDYLIIASGGRYLRKLTGIEHAHIACAGWGPTKSWADRFNAMRGGSLAFGFAGNPQEPPAMRGGPVFEFLFGVETLLRRRKRRDEFELTFFSPAPRPGARLGEKAIDRLLDEMERRDIRTHLGNTMKSIEPDRVVTEGGEFASDLTLFIPGMTGSAWAAESGLTLSQGGFFKADAQCRVEGAEDIYVAGDAGSFPGPDWKPKQAHMADLQAETCVRNLMADIAGQPQTHTFRTELICIIDSLDSGVLVFRNERRNFQFRASPLHWGKSLFEKRYLKPYRRAA